MVYSTEASLRRLCGACRDCELFVGHCVCWVHPWHHQYCGFNDPVLHHVLLCQGPTGVLPHPHCLESVVAMLGSAGFPLVLSNTVTTKFEV